MTFIVYLRLASARLMLIRSAQSSQQKSRQDFELATFTEAKVREGPLQSNRCAPPGATGRVRALRTALEIAEEQGAFLLKLRAATSLARLWRDQGPLRRFSREWSN